jgi:small redox-active disulfide protein 2
MKIEVVGSGCAKCKATEKNVRKAVEELGIQAEIIKVQDIADITKKGVMITPAIIVDGKIEIEGHKPTVDEIKNIISKY